MKRVGIGTLSTESRLQVNHLIQGSIFPSLRVLQHNCGGLCGQFDGMALQLINENESNLDNGARLSFA
jgi:hypothetical protein